MPNVFTCTACVRSRFMSGVRITFLKIKMETELYGHLSDCFIYINFANNSMEKGNGINNNELPYIFVVLMLIRYFIYFFELHIYIYSHNTYIQHTIRTYRTNLK